MSGLGVPMAGAALAAVVTSWLMYLRSIPRGGVARRPVGHVLTHLLGIGLAATALATTPTAPVAVPAAGGLVLGVAFLGLLSLRKTPLGSLKVAVGDPLLPFRCQDSDGAWFESSSLQGQRVLLKFFRGSW